MNREARHLRDEIGQLRTALERAREESGALTAGLEVALRHSELRFCALVEGIPQLVWRATQPGGWTWCSPQWSAFTGQDQQAAHGWGWLEAVHPDDREHVRSASQAATEGGMLELEGRIFHAAEHRYRHFRARALPIYDSARDVLEWLGTSTDVEDLLQLQKQQKVLVAELQHRTRNLMAVVHAVTMRTLRDVSTLDQFRTCIVDRVQALARVQGLLSRRENGQRVPFDVLLRDELSSHVELDERGRSEQVVIDGPAGVGLRSSIVQTLALAIHELATNAIKYGALAQDRGRLRVTWGTRPKDRRECTLWIDWREHGVDPAVTPSIRTPGGGYGRELLERALPYQLGARTHHAFEQDGIHCTIEVEVPLQDNQKEQGDG